MMLINENEYIKKNIGVFYEIYCQYKKIQKLLDYSKI